MHRTQCVVLENDGTVLPAIDRGMVQLVRLLNRPGLRTEFSCQGDDTRDINKQAYVIVAGACAMAFAHALLDDFAERRSWEIGVTFFYAHAGVGIRWHKGYHRKFVARVRRVLEQMNADSTR